MTSRARKALHKSIESNFKSSKKNFLWCISVLPYRPDRNSELLEWGVIVKDIYESKTFCEFYSKDKECAIEFSQKLESKLDNGEDIYWENYHNRVIWHNSVELGGCYE